MKIKEIIGIDISKKDMDVFIHSTQMTKKLENTTKGYAQLLRWVYSNSAIKQENILFIFEHTGMYSHNLACYLTEKRISFSLIPGLEIKRSLGISRGKDDQIDAKKIALFGYRRRGEIKPYHMPGASLIRLKHLYSLRKKLVKDKVSYQIRLKEQQRVYKFKNRDIMYRMQSGLVVQLKKNIKEVEAQIEEVIMQDEKLLKDYKLITSIKNVGPQTATAMIIHTNAFTRFKDSRKFASYCGIAPFPYQSGTSIKGRTKVSNLANKELKTLLNMCAVSALQNNAEMKIYYTKQLAKGKAKRSIINVIRNKILARIFAVVKRRTPYVDILKFAA